MTKPVGTERLSLARWSRRKLAAALETAPPAASSPTAASPSPTVASPTAAVPASAVELPPVESLTFDSDFTAFLKPGIDPTVKRAALKQLFRDPRFNVMDGLDTYIDDYTKADPIPQNMLAELLERFDRSHAPAEVGHADADREASAAAPAAPSSDAASMPAAVASGDARPRTEDTPPLAEPAPAPTAESRRASADERMPPSDVPTSGASG
jgi:hypothetical protein